MSTWKMLVDLEIPDFYSITLNSSIVSQDFLSKPVDNRSLQLMSGVSVL